jgi:hypothetical protein
MNITRRTLLTVPLAAATVAALLSIPSTAGAQDDLPNLCTPGRTAAQPTNYSLPVVARGSDGTLQYSFRAAAPSGALPPFVSTGLQITGDPVSTLSFFVARGTDDQLRYAQYRFDGTVSPFQAAPGLQLAGDPSAVELDIPGVTGFQVFARGQDGTVYTNRITTDGPSGWTNLGNLVVTSDITIRYRGNLGGVRTTRVLARGTDGRVYHANFTGGTPVNWTPLGDLQATSNIALSNSGAFTFARDQAVVRGADNAVWVYDLDGGGPWRSLGGSITSDPAAASDSAGILRVYARGLDNALYVNTLPPGSSWTGFASLGGAITSNPSAYFGFNTFRAQVVARGTDNALYANTIPLTADTFSGYVRVAGTLC